MEALELARAERYTCGAVLGQGLFGKVHKWHDTVLDRPVVIKVRIYF